MTLVIVGPVIILISLIFKFFPPKKINWFYGWRSRFSMMNQGVWEEAQRYGAHLLILGGCALLIIGLVDTFLLQSNSEWVSVISLAIILVAIFVVGESHLKALFEKDGTRRS
ncbi:MAG: SdpI family protein [Oscillospiraceae bacterium]|nr:SdpI family protein [Oscillospiraceae bacterium]